MTAPAEPWRLFWAKTDRSGARPEWTRPLWAHLVDVASVADLLWERMLSRSTRRRIADACGLSDDDARRFVSLLIGMHDIGKAIPPFQQLHPSWQRQSEAGLRFVSNGYSRGDLLHHGHASIPTIIDWLARVGAGLDWPTYTIEAISAGVGYHHGRLEIRKEWQERGCLRDRGRTGGDEWIHARHEMLDAISAAWVPKLPERLAGLPRRWPTWLIELCGWCTLADWLGSMEEAFEDVHHAADVGSYLAISRDGAERAFLLAGMGHRSALKQRAFGDVFRDSAGAPRVPRQLQTVASALPLHADNSSTPSLTIIEAPTGEGKTEAALYLALRQQSDGGSGIYMAMPSQATSNGLFGRLESFIERTHDAESGPANLLLVHGMSGLHPDQERLVRAFLDPVSELAPVYDDDSANVDARVETATWFLPKKRSLLAPYGIGTVDQALLGVLYAKHFFLRLFGLAGKSVIFDEVHAYDTYMNALFLRLLEWLRTIGAHVIVLSATLPSATRREIIAAWTGTAVQPDAMPAPYPAVWSAGDAATVPPITFAAALCQNAVLRTAATDPDAIAPIVIEAARQGAAVAVIVNTVRRAQAVFEAIEANADADFEVMLFHARFPLELRRDLERTVLERFGPGREPGRAAVLVATQVAEQSLDFDVDIMLSDLAPIDLLLQRAGRLHRHEDRHHGRRPSAFAEPILTVLFDHAESGGLPEIDAVSGHGHVYQKAALHRTWRVLRGRDAWQLPDEYRELIEGVYGDDAAIAPNDLGPDDLRRWSECEARWTDSRARELNEAERRYVPPPVKVHTIADITHDELLEPDDVAVQTHAAYLAVTRLGGPSIRIVCLHQTLDGVLWLDCMHTERLDADQATTMNFSRRLIECSVGLSGSSVVRLARELDDPRWSRIVAQTPAVRHHLPMIFTERHWHSLDGSLHYEYHTRKGIIRHESTRRNAHADV